MPTSPRPADFKLTGLIGTLRCCQLFSGLSGEDLMVIAGFVITQKLAKDDYLFHEGEAARGCYLVQSGAINVHRVSAIGKEQVIHVFRSGESFAEAALASPTGYPANARAVEPSTVLIIPKAPILELIGRRPDLALRMLGSMSAHLRVLVGMLDDLTLKDVETRLLNWLVKHGRHAPGGVIKLSGTKRDLAAELGTSSETFSRTLARLRGEKLITVGARAITVLAAPALAARLRRNLGET
jgi:CRP/FNR family transcriptional regulator